MNEKEFIKQYVEKIITGGIKNFPDDFISTDKLQKVKLPGKALHLGEEFFGSFEILNSDGESFLQVNDYNRAKYLIYSNKNLPANTLIPNDEVEIKTSVKKYELYLDNIIKDIRLTLSKTSIEIKHSSNIISEIFRILNLVRY
ncbi:MAG: hypothetical protein IPJ03_07900 [Ignavibacteriales bacterium]|nr:hypothetical protein [Ignavibacteriales bacterium]